MLLREYVLPTPAISTHAIKRILADIGNSSDGSGYIWSTDYALDRLYRLTPATTLAQATTMALEYQLPNYFGTRNPLFLYTDDVNKSIWFTNPASGQISRLDYFNNILWDWNVGTWGTPGDIERLPNGDVVFTFMNTTIFGILNPVSMLLSIYQIFAVGGPAPGVGALAKIAHNTTHYYMTDLLNDFIYEFQVGVQPWMSLANVYPLNVGGQSHDITLDTSDNIWVTQPGLDFVCEQLTGSQNKMVFDVGLEYENYVEYNLYYLDPEELPVPIKITPIRATVFETPPNVTGDPLATWHIPTVTSLPIGIDTDNLGYAWFTCPGDNKMVAIDPIPTNMTYEYLLPTPNCLPLYTTISEDDHVWFTEYAVQTFGEIFYEDYVDIRVCPNRPKHYPPPNPGSIRWTWEPGAEIWVDAPSNGYNPSDHDQPERPGVNHVYATIKNLGTDIATNINVSFYYHNMSLGFAQWIPLSADPNPTAWTYIDSYIIASLAPGAQQDVYVDWSIPTTAPIHQCIGVQAKCTTDISLYDNVCYRNLDIVSAFAGAPATITRAVWITNNRQQRGLVKVAPGAPPPGLRSLPPGWQISIEPNNFYLEPGESRKLLVTFTLPSTTVSTEIVSMSLTGTIDDEVVGYVWFEFRLVSRSTITCLVTPSTIFPGEVVYFSGTISPAVVNATVYIHFTKPDGTTYTIGTTTNSTSGYDGSTGLNDITGAYTVYSYWYGNTKYSEALSTACQYNVIVRPIFIVNTDFLIGLAIGFGIMAIVLVSAICILLRRKS